MGKTLFFAAILCAGLMTSGCSMLDNLMGTAKSTGEDAAVSAVIDNYKAMPKVSLHKDLKEGQWATWTASAAGQKTDTTWAVTGKQGDDWIVESRMKMGDWTMAVAHVCDAEGNVKKAYAAKYEPDAEELAEGKEVGLMELKTPETNETVETAKDVVEGEESIKAADKDFDAKTIEVGDNKTWTAKEGWYFNSVLRTQVKGETNYELTAIGDDAKAGVKIPEEK